MMDRRCIYSIIADFVYYLLIIIAVFTLSSMITSKLGTLPEPIEINPVLTPESDLIKFEHVLQTIFFHITLYMIGFIIFLILLTTVAKSLLYSMIQKIPYTNRYFLLFLQKVSISFVTCVLLILLISRIFVAHGALLIIILVICTFLYLNTFFFMFAQFPIRTATKKIWDTAVKRMHRFILYYFVLLLAIFLFTLTIARPPYPIIFLVAMILISAWLRNRFLKTVKELKIL